MPTLLPFSLPVTMREKAISHRADTQDEGGRPSGSDGNGEQTQTSYSGMQSARGRDNTAIHLQRVSGLFLVQYVKWTPRPHPTTTTASSFPRGRGEMAGYKSGVYEGAGVRGGGAGWRALGEEGK